MTDQDTKVAWGRFVCPACGRKVEGPFPAAFLAEVHSSFACGKSFGDEDDTYA